MVLKKPYNFWTKFGNFVHSEMKEIRSRGAYDERRIFRNTKVKAFKRQVRTNRSKCKCFIRSKDFDKSFS